MTRFGQPGVLTNPSWSSLTTAQQTSEARLMEVYAAMLTNLDDNVGRVIDYLKSIDEYDNTMIVFFSDNGADGMGRSEEHTSELPSLLRFSYAVFCFKKKIT